MSRCVRTWIKLTPDYPFDSHCPSGSEIQARCCFCNHFDSKSLHTKTVETGEAIDTEVVNYIQIVGNKCERHYIIHDDAFHI